MFFTAAGIFRVVVFGIFSFGKKLLSVTASSLQESL
jgi:hypothetical protein